jgi:hypothetical protein
MSLTVAIPFPCYSRIENKKKATREPQVAKVHRWTIVSERPARIK